MRVLIAAGAMALVLIAASIWQGSPWNWGSASAPGLVPVNANWHAAGPVVWLHGEPGNYLGFGPSTLLTCTPGLRGCFAVIQTNGIGLNGQAALAGVAPGFSPAQSSMFRSTNTGRSWARLALPSKTWVSTPLSCPSNDTCFAGALRGTVDTPGDSGVPVLLKTTDAGARWTSVAMPSSVGLIVSVSCPSQSRCAALTWAHNPESIRGMQPVSGVSRFFPTHMLTTTNAGATWAPWRLPGLNADRFVQMSNLDCPSIQTCYVEADEATIVASDGGYNPVDHVGTVLRSTTWDGPLLPVVSEPNQTWSPMTCTSSALCLAVVATGLGPPRMQEIRATAAAATRFTTQGLPADFDPAALTCPTASRCVMSGWGGVLYSSTDGGHTWSRSSIGPPKNQSIKFFVIANLACDKVFRCLGLTDGETKQSSYAPAAEATTPITNIP